MRRLVSFMLVLGMCGSVFANDVNVRTSVQNMKEATSDSITFTVPSTHVVTSDSLNVKGSKELCFYYDVSSDGTVDVDLDISYSPDGTAGSWTGTTKLADVTSTGKGIANVTTFYPLPYVNIAVDGDGSNDTSTTVTIKAGQR